MKMGRPKTNRSEAIKVGYKIMPEYVKKIEFVAELCKVSNSKALELIIDRATTDRMLPVYECKECRVRFQSKEKCDYCLECEFKRR